MDDEPTGDDGGSNRPTYFEVVTALALLRFAQCRVDAAVLEVGLGGRLDSTNVCQPLVSVITNISFDHTQQLGNTLAAIAAEKAGIIKFQKPVVSGVVDAQARQVVADTARRHDCRLVQGGRDFDYCYRPPRGLDIAPAQGRMDFHESTDGVETNIVDLELSLAGSHQAANAAVGIATLCELRRLGWSIPDSAVRQGLADVRWPARVEVVRRNPTVVLDAAHNVASIEALVRVVDESFSPGPRLLVFATTRDKDIRGMLQVLLPAFEEVIYTRYFENPRGVAPDELAAMAAEISPAAAHVCPDPATAWSLAQQLASPRHLVCITGSFFIAAQMRAAMRDAAVS